MKVSTNFLVLMSFEFQNRKGIAWDDADALQSLDLPCRPSATKSDPVPPKLEYSEAKVICDLIEEIRRQSNVNQARQFVEAKTSDGFDAGRDAYGKWYRSHLGSRVNKRMNAAMAASNNTIPDVLRLQEDDTYPTVNAFHTNDIGVELLGDVLCNGQVLSSKASLPVQGLIAATLNRVRKTYNAGQNIILGKKLQGSRQLDSSLWFKSDRLMSGACTCHCLRKENSRMVSSIDAW
jgi:hypothetical protein